MRKFKEIGYISYLRLNEMGFRLYGDSVLYGEVIIKKWPFGRTVNKKYSINIYQRMMDNIYEFDNEEEMLEFIEEIERGRYRNKRQLLQELSSRCSERIVITR